jgi:RimJ/RimL family protein N-acetyltransferase
MNSNLVKESKMNEIDTNRLKLRQWTDDDSDVYIRYFADEKNSKYFGGRKCADDAWRHMAMQIGHWQLKGFGYWAVDEKESGDFVGCVGLWKSPSWPELELGYWIASEQQRKGYAKEAAKECVKYARNVLKAESLVSYIDPSNEPSIKLAGVLGASYEETIELAEQGFILCIDISNHSIHNKVLHQTSHIVAFFVKKTQKIAPACYAGES